VYGSVARGEEDRGSDIDLLVVGQVDLAELRAVLRDLECRLGREINETVYGTVEFSERRRAGDAFLERVMQGPKIMLAGSTDALD
jgi:predicted nucleotidyltransferase